MEVEDLEGKSWVMLGGGANLPRGGGLNFGYGQSPIDNNQIVNHLMPSFIHQPYTPQAPPIQHII